MQRAAELPREQRIISKFHQKTLLESEFKINITDRSMTRIRRKSGTRTAVDNATAHEEGVQWLKDRGVNFIEWGPNSSDCNPVEEIWEQVRTRVAQELVGKERPDRDTLIALYRRHYTAFTANVDFTPYVDTMPSRLENLLANQGGNLDRNY